MGEAVKVAVISANLGRFEAPVVHCAQSIPYTDRLFTDADLPPRRRTMTARLQAKIPKFFGWDLVPAHNIYVWIDASFRMAQPDSLAWLVGQLGDHETAFYRHPTRLTVDQEIGFIRDKMPTSRRLIERYENEDVDGLMRELGWPGRLKLYAAGIFVYRPTERVMLAFRDWWYLVTRFHVNDQLSLAAALNVAGIVPVEIDSDIFHDPRFEFMRSSVRRRTEAPAEHGAPVAKDGG